VHWCCCSAVSFTFYFGSELLHNENKFVDDTTFSEIIPKGETNSNMSSLVENILHWSQCNLRSETKELVLGSDLAENICREL